MKSKIKDQVMFLTSYPPRECGIATYSRDLINAIKNKFSRSFDIKVCALDNSGLSPNYPKEVTNTLDTSKQGDYLHLAEKINTNDAVKMVFIQHEFGLFGGENGSYLFPFLFALQKPISVTFHSVLPHPDGKLREAVQTIAGQVNSIVVMTKRSAKILFEIYGVKAHKITLIPHGTHIVKWEGKEKTKERYGVSDRLVLTTFGLLSSNKSIETAIDAIPAIKEKFPNILYLVLGKTHPGIIDTEGEQYRKYLEQKVWDLGVNENVRFVNRYLELEELLDFLRLTEIYLFTSKDPNQAVSGTFAYAMSCGCPVISTPIPHAKEMLQNGGGVLIDFNSPEQMAVEANRLLSDNNLCKNIGRRAFQQTQASGWSNVAIPHVRLFATHISRKKELQYDYPEISLKHIYKLTNSSGMIQFSDICEPDIESGYTLDDNARALIALCMHYHHSGQMINEDMIDIYLKFIEHCQLQDGSFLNYVDKNGIHTEKNNYVNLEDSNGRALWALGIVIAHEDILSKYHIRIAENIFLEYLPWTKKLGSPRSMAFAIKGLYNYNQTRHNGEISNIIDQLAGRLLENYNIVQSDKWKWFEAHLTYANSVIPEAMLMAYLETGNLKYCKTAEESFDFLLSKIFHKGMIRVVSNRGWMHRGKIPETYGEQPIDVAYTIIALELFWKIKREKRFYQLAESAFSWFLGHNHLNQIMYNPTTGGCYDGLEEHEVNINQGAESTVCYLIARLTMEKVNNSVGKVNSKTKSRKAELVYSTRDGILHKQRENIRGRYLKNRELSL